MKRIVATIALAVAAISPALPTAVASAASKPPTSTTTTTNKFFVVGEEVAWVQFVLGGYVPRLNSEAISALYGNATGSAIAEGCAALQANAFPTRAKSRTDNRASGYVACRLERPSHRGGCPRRKSKPEPVWC